VPNHKLIHTPQTLWLTPLTHHCEYQYLGPLNYVADLPGRRPLRSATTNRLAVLPVKLTTITNQPGFPGCRPTDMKRSVRRRDFSWIVIQYPPSISYLKLTCLPNPLPDHSLDRTSPNLSLVVLAVVVLLRLLKKSWIDWLISSDMLLVKTVSISINSAQLLASTYQWSGSNVGKCLQAFAGDYFPETFDATLSSENRASSTDQQDHCTATHGPTNNIHTYKDRKFQIIINQQRPYISSCTFHDNIICSLMINGLK